MYLDYWTTGFTDANLQADLFGALGGTITDKNNFSASCDIAKTTLITTVASGWTVHDASAGSNKKCFKAPVSDDADNYKYATFYVAAGVQALTSCATWDAGSHTGTYQCTSIGSSAYGAATSTEVSRIILAASARFIYYIAYGYAPTSTSGQWGGKTAGSYAGHAVLERERLFNWDTVGTTYPYGVNAWVGNVGASGVDASYSQIPFFPTAAMVSPRTDAYPVTPPTCNLYASHGISAPADGRQAYSTATPGQREVAIAPIVGYIATQGPALGNLSAKSGIYCAFANGLPWFSEFTFLNKTYVLQANNIIIPKE
ncbi:MAG: hypothetical protein HQL74_07280 [Magnetococcales bacterium]|nr:hypothetical protein [Magnetococcales bacterium]